MQVETICTLRNYLYIVTSGFFSQNKVEKICLISWGVFNKTRINRGLGLGLGLGLLTLIKQIIPLALVGYEIIIANEARSASLAIYHLISNARSWNNC